VSFLLQLLTQTEPLEKWETNELKHWLKTLESDCELLGETSEDTARMNAIRERIANVEGMGQDAISVVK